MVVKSEPAGNDSSHGKTLKPSTIMHLVYAVYPSFAMLAGMQLDLFTALDDKALTAKSLADSLGVLEDRIAPLLYSLVAAGLLELKDGFFSNTEEAGEFLVCRRPNFMGSMSGFYRKLWNAALNTAESIRTGKPKLKIDWQALPEEELLTFFKTQFHSSLRAGKEIADKLDFSEFGRLLDAGGGTGGVCIGICNKYPHIQATVADFPKVVQVTERFIKEAGMSGRITVSPTDLSTDRPEGQYDVAILRAFIQTISKEQARTVLKNIAQSIVPGGRIYIIGGILENSRLSPLSSLGMGLVFLNFYDDGRAYTEKEHEEMLTAAGFTAIVPDHEALSDGMGIISARRLCRLKESKKLYIQH
ncbi:MAG: methyltransferase [Syntrophobacteraceae bacterium]